MSRKGNTTSVLIITILLLLLLIPSSAMVIANTILDKTTIAYGQTNQMNSNLTNPIASQNRWKMAIVTFIGAYCISLLASFILRPLGLQPLLFNLIMTIILVIGLTYFAMPLLSRLLRRWLYPRNL
jgi:antibiotic biosynthesis monooxygenase (ABM) superfamily enzyme